MIQNFFPFKKVYQVKLKGKLYYGIPSEISKI